MSLPALSPGQFSLVYNLLSLAVAAMLGSFIFFVLARSQVSAIYRPALVMSSLVVAIAGYHYLRIFSSWNEAYHFVDGQYVATGQPFNDAYRYVDWLLTVPLLCAELVSVLSLKKSLRGNLMGKLVIAAALMIVTGYPGEVAAASSTRAIWGTISTFPFLYIVYQLFSVLDRSLAGQAPAVRVLFRNTRLLILGTWGFYPIVYLFPLLGIGGAAATVGVQVGYSLADIAAKCGYGLMIYAIARAKMAAESEVPVAYAPALASRA